MSVVHAEEQWTVALKPRVSHKRQRLISLLTTNPEIHPKDAMRLVGYSDKTIAFASRAVVEHPAVQDAIAKARRETRIRHQMTIDKALLLYLEAFERAKGDGTSKEMIKAADSIVKMLGLANPEVEAFVKQKHAKDLEQLSDAKLMEYIQHWSQKAEEEMGDEEWEAHNE